MRERNARAASGYAPVPLKFTAALICLVMLVTLLPAGALAETPASPKVMIGGVEVKNGYAYYNSINDNPAYATPTEFVDPAATPTDWGAYLRDGTLYVHGLYVRDDVNGKGIDIEGDVTLRVVRLGTVHAYTPADNADNTVAGIRVRGSLTITGDGELYTFAALNEKTESEPERRYCGINVKDGSLRIDGNVRVWCTGYEENSFGACVENGGIEIKSGELICEAAKTGVRCTSDGSLPGDILISGGRLTAVGTDHALDGSIATTDGMDCEFVYSESTLGTNPTSDPSALPVIRYLSATAQKKTEDGLIRWYNNNEIVTDIWKNSQATNIDWKIVYDPATNTLTISCANLGRIYAKNMGCDFKIRMKNGASIWYTNVTKDTSGEMTAAVYVTGDYPSNNLTLVSEGEAVISTYANSAAVSGLYVDNGKLTFDGSRFTAAGQNVCSEDDGATYGIAVRGGAMTVNEGVTVLGMAIGDNKQAGHAKLYRSIGVVNESKAGGITVNGTLKGSGGTASAERSQSGGVLSASFISIGENGRLEAHSSEANTSCAIQTGEIINKGRIAAETNGGEIVARGIDAVRIYMHGGSLAAKAGDAQAISCGIGSGELYMYGGTLRAESGTVSDEPIGQFIPYSRAIESDIHALPGNYAWRSAQNGAWYAAKEARLTDYILKNATYIGLKAIPLDPLPGNGDETPQSTNVYAQSNTIWLTGAGLTAYDALVVDKLTGDAAQGMLALSGKNEVFGNYDIHLANGKKGTGSAMYLHFATGRANAGQEFTLVHNKADGTNEYFYATAAANGDVAFGPLYELSPFMLVRGHVTADAAVTAVTTVAAAEIPQTGDGGTVAGGVMVAVAVLAAVCVGRRRANLR